jgi:hypothetical protein
MSEENSSSGGERLLNVVNFMRQFKNHQVSSPLYFKHTDPSHKDAGLVHFERHFNADLAQDSRYFKSM